MNLIQYKSSSNTAKNCAYILLEQLKKKKLFVLCEKT